jgi:hypothetical protein
VIGGGPGDAARWRPAGRAAVPGCAWVSTAIAARLRNVAAWV